MTPQEIKERVDSLYDEVEKAIGQGIFVLNPRIQEIYDELEMLEEMCPHEYDELGHCIYCYHDKQEDN